MLYKILVSDMVYNIDVIQDGCKYEKSCQMEN